jgi:hypothetical protein
VVFAGFSRGNEEAVGTQQRLKIALDELRMLMMGSQILFGFQLRAVFEKQAQTLGVIERGLLSAATLLMALVVGILIAGPCYHRIVEMGAANDRVLRIITGLASCALLPFALSLGCDFSLVTRKVVGPGWSWFTGAAMVLLSLGLWYGAAIAIREIKEGQMAEVPAEHVPLPTKIDQMLTEARVILPGAQAVLGFQLIAIMTEPFDDLPSISKGIHLASMIAVGLAVILLMGPAALHRLGFGGEAKPEMLTFGSWLVTAALLPLGLGISGDVFVAIGRLSGSAGLGAVAGGSILLILLALWYGWPTGVRHRQSRSA